MPDASATTGSSTTARGPARNRDWVRETRFGRWFLGTQTWSRYVVAVAINELANLLPADFPAPRRILDVGCGPGVSLPLLDQRFHPESIVAIDIDPDEVGRSGRQARLCACQVDVHRGDATHLEFADGRFDLVLCHQLLHHMVPQAAALQEFRRVLAPGGALLLAESCRSFILSLPVQALFRHPNHVQKSAAEYQQLVRDAGFELSPDRVHASTPFWSKLDWGLSERIGLRRNSRREPTEIMLVAFKPRA